MSEMDFTTMQILFQDDINRKQPFDNPEHFTQVSNEAIQLYLGEKECNDQNEVDMRLDEYLRDKKSLGR